jgi:hypothetical protein
MSDERFEQEERQDEDVEAHGHTILERNTAAQEELGEDDDNDDVEAHRRRTA